MSQKDKLTAAGFTYCGEATEYSRYLRPDTINGVTGRWIRHEFGGECFQPSSTDRGYHNNGCWEKK